MADLRTVHFSCIECGKPFTLTTDKKNFLHTCSEECRRERILRVDRERKQRIRKNKNRVRTCPICGNEFVIVKGEHGRKICSDECRRVQKNTYMKEYREAHKKVKPKCKPSLENCLNCPYDDCICTDAMITDEEQKVVKQQMRGYIANKNNKRWEV